jgi:hypothetical protein
MEIPVNLVLEATVERWIRLSGEVFQGQAKAKDRQRGCNKLGDEAC